MLPRFFILNVIRLSARLSAVAELVPQDARVIDVGTDHAMVPVWLIQTGRASHVWAADIRPGPLKNAARLIRETDTGSKIELRQTDGLAGFCREDGDTVVIAGMGGETMVSILSAAPWLHSNVLLILEPQSKQDVLRRWLAANGYDITAERLVQDGGRIYPILTAAAGHMPACEEIEYYTGRYERIGDDSLFGEYLALLRKRIGSAAPYDPQSKKLMLGLDALEERRNNDTGK